MRIKMKWRRPAATVARFQLVLASMGLCIAFLALIVASLVTARVIKIGAPGSWLTSPGNGSSSGLLPVSGQGWIIVIPVPETGNAKELDYFPLMPGIRPDLQDFSLGIMWACITVLLCLTGLGLMAALILSKATEVGRDIDEAIKMSRSWLCLSFFLWFIWSLILSVIGFTTWYIPIFVLGGIVLIMFLSCLIIVCKFKEEISSKVDRLPTLEPQYLY